MTQLQHEELPWLFVLFPEKLPDTVKLMRRLRREGENLFHNNLSTGLKFVQMMEKSETEVLELQARLLESVNQLDKQGVLWLFSLADAWKPSNTYMLLLRAKVANLEFTTLALSRTT